MKSKKKPASLRQPKTPTKSSVFGTENINIVETLNDRIAREMAGGVRAKLPENKRPATYKTLSAVQEHNEVAQAYFNKYVVPTFGRKDTGFANYIKDKARHGIFLGESELEYLRLLFGDENVNKLQDVISRRVLSSDAHFTNNKKIRATIAATPKGAITKYTFINRTDGKLYNYNAKNDFYAALNTLRGSDIFLEIYADIDRVTGYQHIIAIADYT